MANRYLIPLYKMLFDTDFSYSEFKNRMKMQKGIYLLQDMGVPVGDYGFRWYIHGPYSQSLQDDMFYEDGKPESIIALSEESARSVQRLHNVIHSASREDYSMSQWLECLASIRYLKENILRRSVSEDDVVAELVERKPHLSNSNVNHAAYRLIEGLFS